MRILAVLAVLCVTTVASACDYGARGLAAPAQLQLQALPACGYGAQVAFSAYQATVAVPTVQQVPVYAQRAIVVDGRQRVIVQRDVDFGGGDNRQFGLLNFNRNGGGGRNRQLGVVNVSR